MSREIIKGVHREVTIDWFICQADDNDIKHANSAPKAGDPDYRRKGPNPVRKPGLKRGDELWRTAHGVGPFYPDHDHWSGNHISGSQAQLRRVAELIANDPSWPEDDS